MMPRHAGGGVGISVVHGDGALHGQVVHLAVLGVVGLGAQRAGIVHQSVLGQIGRRVRRAVGLQVGGASHIHHAQRRQRTGHQAAVAYRAHPAFGAADLQLQQREQGQQLARAGAE